MAYVNISNGPSIWVQFGFGRWRILGTTTKIDVIYREYFRTGIPHVIWNYIPGPADGSAHEYECVLDKSTGTWTLNYDRAFWFSYTDAALWKGKTGTSAQWMGEIYCQECDMPGHEGEDQDCAYNACKYKWDGGGYVPGGFEPPVPINPGANANGHWTDNQTFEIWTTND